MVKKENYGYLKQWADVYIDEIETDRSVMSGYHAHDYYEISVILSGDVNLLTEKLSSNGVLPRILLSAPGVAHYVTCAEGTLYKRINIVFSGEFVSSADFLQNGLLSTFRSGGNILEVDIGCAQRLADIIRKIKNEENRFRRLLLLMYLLSLISDIDSEFAAVKASAPTYIADAMNYVNEHFSEKIIAGELAFRLGIGRTTFMTSFKKHTGSTFSSYVTGRRINEAVKQMKNGCSESVAAERCGFGESSNMVRSFKRTLGLTPSKYMKFIVRK